MASLLSTEHIGHESTNTTTRLPPLFAHLQLRFELQDNNQTILAQCKQQLPLRVVRAFPLNDGAALVHLHNLSGGVLGGDQLEVTIDVGRYALAQVTSTGATRIYRSRGAAAALQRLQIRIEDNALCEYLPDPLIPFSDSRYRQETNIDLGENSGLFWWEIVSPGREARDEVFDYSLLQLKTRINALRKPIALEHIKLEPSRRSILSVVRLGGAYRYFSTFYICRVGVEPSRWLELEAQLGELAEQLSQPSRIVWGVSSLSSHGLVVRALSSTGWAIITHLPDFWHAAKRYLYDRDAVLPRKIY